MPAALVHAQELVTRTITLTWNASTSADVVGYRLYYGEQRGYYTHHVDAGSSTSVEVPNLVEGTTYYFAVSAFVPDGTESSPSDEFCYTSSPALLLNMSMRATVQTGDNVVIAGFIVGGRGEKKVIIRALGPTLSASGVNGVLWDPTLELVGPSGTIGMNDNWRDGNWTALAEFGLVPSSETEAAIVATLAPGAYSVIMRGSNDSTGVALLEVYDAGTP